VYSAEVSATPTAPPPGLITAQVRFTPAAIDGECLLSEGHDGDGVDHDDDDDDGGHACPRWLYATIELPAGNDPSGIARASVRLAGSVPPDPGFGAFVDEDHDSLRELKLRFAFREVRPRLTIGSDTLRVSGRAGESEFRGDGAVQVSSLDVDLYFTPRTLNRRSQGDPVQARLTFRPGVGACEVSLPSIRLNGAVPALKRISCDGNRVTFKFDRSAVAAALSPGDHVEVTVTGSIRGLDFRARDSIRVTQ